MMLLCYQITKTIEELEKNGDLLLDEDRERLVMRKLFRIICRCQIIVDLRIFNKIKV